MGFVRHFWSCLGLVFALGIVVLLGGRADPALALKRAEKYLSTPEMAKMVYDDVTFGTADGLLLHGWFLPFQDQYGEAHREPKPTIILVTDGTDNMGSVLWHYYNFFRGAPWHVLMFDWRGMGTSARWSADTTQVVIPEQLKDLKAAIQYAKERPEHDGEHLGVFAFGAGAAVALAAAAGAEDIQAVAVRGIYTTQSEYCARRRAARPPMACNANPKWPAELEPIQAASRVKGAVLVVVGENDGVAPKEMAQAILERIPGPKQLWVAPKAGHEGYDAPEVIHLKPFTVKIHGFFGRYLGTE